MFNLIMLSNDWSSGSAKVSISRILEYTDDHIINLFKQGNSLKLDELAQLPCLFMEEGTDSEKAYIGHIARTRITGQELVIEYNIDTNVPPLQNSFIYDNRTELDMPNVFEFSRNHWAVKDVDLYRFLLKAVRPRRQHPTVFHIPEHENIEPTLASAMMPFDASFNSVYNSIGQASANVGLRCRRADDIWENAAIIQDVVALIDRSRVVVCDCTSRNPNVFYEAGIAHTLGREVILITQSEHDIPFDLRHLRYIRYHNNGEGLVKLTEDLEARMRTILGH